MLLRYKVKNFCSFKDEVVFSMKPGKVISRFEDNVVYINPRLKILKAAVIEGENAGGKTNFMKSLEFLKYLFESDSNPRIYNKLAFKYNTNETQFFEISVLASNNMIYTYSLTLDSYSPVEESLYIRTASQDETNNKRIFISQRSDFKKHEKDNAERLKITYNIDIDYKYIDKELKSIIEARVGVTQAGIGLVLKYLSLIGVSIVLPLTEWISNSLILNLPQDHSLNFYKQILKEEEDLSIIKEEGFLEIFRLVDSAITKIEVNDEEPFEKTIIVRKTEENSEFRIELQNESSGTREFFAWSIQLWKVLNKNIVLFADEIDKVLNSILSEKIISLIQGSDHRGQFIFSTHNVMHLNTNIFMKEQLNFISKKKETLSSELYSLADFKEYRYDKADVYDLYLKGILGGVPND
ncbi:AAA family ATPase [Ruminiclostridium josui]|uniref:AAA family ATPase n=1 Tax=Ruminiclostridium josui TaxID=1499 RepID=UPI0004678C34|nr:AAA family ATPase [Ruminiclostridium josui]